MKASFTSRITCSVLAATLAALPCNEALAAPTATTTAAPTATPPAAGTPAKPTSTAPTTGTSTTTTTTGTTTTTAPAAGTTPPATTTAPAAGTTSTTTTTTTTPTTGTAPAGDPNTRAVEGTDAITAPGETPTDVSGETPAEPPPEPPAPEVVAPPAPPPVPVGPERPPEPTVANGKYKAKGTGLMIAGGSLLGLGIIGLVTSVVLTRCDELDNSFACKNKQNSTFAIPATGAAALLGAVLLAVGVGYRVRYKKWENWKPSNAPQNTALYPTLLRGGAGVGYTLKF